MDQIDPSAKREQASSSTTVGARELRRSLSSLVHRAAKGERIVVTLDGEPVAQLGPLEPSDKGVELADLAAAGLVERPQRFDRPDATDPLLGAAEVSLDRLVDRLRGR